MPPLRIHLIVSRSDHTERVLQARHLHNPSHQMQTSRHEHFPLPCFPDNVDSVLDGGDDVNVFLGEIWVDFGPGVREGVLGG